MSSPRKPDKPLHPRLARERRTVAAMMGIYCRAKHGGAELCAECADLLVYAALRLEHCPYGGGKPPCLDCPRRCYAPARRARIQQDLGTATCPRIYAANINTIFVLPPSAGGFCKNETNI